jgi:hypothetical protein
MCATGPSLAQVVALAGVPVAVREREASDRHRILGHRRAVDEHVRPAFDVALIGSATNSSVPAAARCHHQLLS